MPYCHYCYNISPGQAGTKLKFSIVSKWELLWLVDVWWVWQDVGVGEGEVWKYFWLIFSRSAVVTVLYEIWPNVETVNVLVEHSIYRLQYFRQISLTSTLLPQDGQKNRTWYSSSSRHTNIYDLLSDFVIGNLFQYCPSTYYQLIHHFPSLSSLHTKKQKNGTILKL